MLIFQSTTIALTMLNGIWQKTLFITAQSNFVFFQYQTTSIVA